MAHDLTPGDIDGDGDEDLISVGVNDHALRLYTNDGSGRFQLSQTLKTGRSPRVVKTGDLDGDGLKELVVGGDAGRLYLHWQMSPGHFPEYTSLRSTSATWGLGLADLDKNGTLRYRSDFIPRQAIIYPSQ